MEGSQQGKPPTPDELEQLLAAGEQQQAVMIASQQIIHRRFNFDVQTTAEGARVLILTSVLPSGVPLDEHVFVFQNLDNAAALGGKLSAPSVVLPGRNGTGPDA